MMAGPHKPPTLDVDRLIDDRRTRIGLGEHHDGERLHDLDLFTIEGIQL